eukprot:SM000030S11418  [mRNA]  locus=s30:543654:545558:- [translate_table: standard]
MSPLVAHLNLYDIANVKGVAADLSHCNTPAQVSSFTGPDELRAALAGADLVIIPAGIPRKPGMSRDDLFNINAGIVQGLIEAVADAAPGAMINIISNPVNSTVPIAAEVLKRKGAYDARKLFGVTTLDVVRANTFVAEMKGLRLMDVDVPVVGGHAGTTILPLLSKTKPSVDFSEEEVAKLTPRIQNAGTEVVEVGLPSAQLIFRLWESMDALEQAFCKGLGPDDIRCAVLQAKAGAGSATLSMAYAAARFAESCLRALDGDSDVYECAYVESDLVPELPFFASRVKLGKRGVEALVPSDLEGLTASEQAALDSLKDDLKGSIDKGFAFANKEAAPAPAAAT